MKPFIALCLLISTASLHAATLEGEVTLQARYFQHEGAAGQSRFQPSLAFQGEMVLEPSARDQVVFSPFFRLDGEDAARTHGDIRELYWTQVHDTWEWSLGVKQVFWGVTEFHHLVDIVNQTDQVENVDDEDRLGQPLAQLSFVRDWGIVDVMMLFGHRERTFAGRDGRLRLPIKIDDSRSTYASGADDRRVDGAIRWSNQFDDLDIALHHFSGTSRDPELRLSSDGSRLVPHYQVIDQTGVEAQYLSGDWAFKLEALSRTGDGDRYAAAVLGLEHTLVGVMDSTADVGVVVEYLYDDRGERAHNTLFDNDIAVGARFTLNDIADTNALVGFIWDADTGERVLSLEAERRFGSDWLLRAEGRAFGGSRRVPADQPFRAITDLDHRAGFLEREDFFQLELTRYF